MASSGAAGICQCSYFMVRLTFFLFGKYGAYYLRQYCLIILIQSIILTKSSAKVKREFDYSRDFVLQYGRKITQKGENNNETDHSAPDGAASCSRDDYDARACRQQIGLFRRAGQALGGGEHRAVQTVQFASGHRQRQIRPRAEDDARGVCRGAVPPDGLEDRHA